jgi:hypothetical protein
MALWSNLDGVSGNSKPKYANTSNITSQSSIHGEVANTVAYYGSVFGVSATEASNTVGDGPKITHPGWVSQKIGTGPIKSIGLSGGIGYNAAGYLVVVDTSGLAQGTGANISYTIANSQNSLEGYSSNAQLNVISSITVVNGGSGYSEGAKVTVAPTGSYITKGTFTVNLGGRGGRRFYETLVATGSIQGDDPTDDPFFPGV